jgi:hypothetical protein
VLKLISGYDSAGRFQLRRKAHNDGIVRCSNCLHSAARTIFRGGAPPFLTIPKEIKQHCHNGIFGFGGGDHYLGKVGLIQTQLKAQIAAARKDAPGS